MDKKVKFTDKVLNDFEKNNNDSYIYLSPQLKPHIYYMLDFISHLSGKDISVVITDQIRETLFELVIRYLSNDAVSETEAKNLLKVCPREIQKRLYELGIFEEREESFLDNEFL